MEETNYYKENMKETARFEQTPNSFITLCHLIKNQELRYDDAWDIVKDIVRANIRYDDKPF